MPARFELRQGRGGLGWVVFDRHQGYSIASTDSKAQAIEARDHLNDTHAKEVGSETRAQFHYRMARQGYAAVQRGWPRDQLPSAWVEGMAHYPRGQRVLDLDPRSYP